MQPEWFLKIILPGRLSFKNNTWVNAAVENQKRSWSFSNEWKEHLLTQQQKTWDLTAAERLQHFFSETKTIPEQLPGKLVLDAGCGNGQLTKAISTTKANVVGIDRQLYLPGGEENLQFVQDDFDDPPFIAQSFDIVIANGSIHHTKNTFHSFSSLAKLVKEDGKLYVWVYKKQKGWKRILLGCLDLSRFIISRIPPWLQRIKVNALTQCFYILSRIRKGENSSRTKDEIRINVYDAFTPRYRYYFSTEEVNKWFTDCGFEQVAVTHNNNKYGFGMLGIKIKNKTPSAEGVKSN